MQKQTVVLLLILMNTLLISCQQKKTTEQKNNTSSAAATVPDKLKNPSSVPPFDTIKVHSLIIETTTYNHENNSTDDPVYVKLNDAMPGYYLDNPGDDRELNQVDRYYIVDSHIQRIGDIKYLKLVKEGHDNWTYLDLKIIVNGSVIFSARRTDSRGFPVVVLLNEGNSQPEALYLFNTLRANPFWNVSSPSIFDKPLSISKAELITAVGSMVGNSMHYATNGKKYDWDKSHDGHNITSVGARSTATFTLFLKENNQEKTMELTVQSSFEHHDAVFDIQHELWPGDPVYDNIGAFLNISNVGGPGIFDANGNLTYQ